MSGKEKDTIFHFSPQVIFQIDPQGAIIQANPAAEQQLNITQNNIKSCQEVCPDFLSDQIHDCIKNSQQIRKQVKVNNAYYDFVIQGKNHL